MCGIFSILGPQCEDAYFSFQRGEHRGPENTVYERVNHYVTMGFHRLAINGHGKTSSEQPMKIDGCVLICNGEMRALPSGH